MPFKDLALNHGHIVSVKGSVVDVEFADQLPAIYTLLLTGSENEIAIEVLSQLNSRRVRGIALTPTQGLARGMKVTSTGEQLTVPIGKSIIGRMFDVFGNTIDHGEPLKDMKRKSIHQAPPTLSKRSTKSEIFIKDDKALKLKIFYIFIPIYQSLPHIWAMNLVSVT